MPPEATPDLVAQRLGVGKINNKEKREAVNLELAKLSPEQRTELVYEKSRSERIKLDEQIQLLNTNSKTVHGFMQEVQRSVLDNEFNQGYTENSPQKSYLEYFISLVGTNGDFSLPQFEDAYKGKGLGISWKDKQTGEYCVNKLRSLILAIPVDAKAEARHQYAPYITAKYAKALEEAQRKTQTKIGPLTIGSLALSDVMEIQDPESFDIWAKNNNKKDGELRYKLSEVDAKTVADVKVPPVLEKNTAAFEIFSKFSDEIKTSQAKYDELKSKDSSFDPKFSEQIKALEQKYKDQTQAISGETDSTKRLGLMNVDDLKKSLLEINASMDAATAKKPEADDEKPTTSLEGSSATTSEDGDNEKPTLVDKFVLGNSKLQKIIQDFANKEPLSGFILSFFLVPSTLKAMGIKGSTDMGGFIESITGVKNPEQANNIKEKAKKIIQDHFSIKSPGELEILTKTSVREFLNKKPKDFDETRYKAFKLALEKNQAKDAPADQKVFEFVISKAENWKEKATD